MCNKYVTSLLERKCFFSPSADSSDGGCVGAFEVFESEEGSPLLRVSLAGIMDGDG